MTDQALAAASAVLAGAPVRLLQPAANACFHCGLPLAGAHGLTVTIDGAAREMCCPGCRAVGQAIVDGGLERYYLHRDALPASAADTVPALQAELLLYDDPSVQASFVRPVGPMAQDPASGEREAALLIEGITCAACVWLTERALERVPGVTGVEVNYSTRRARVRWDARRGSLSSILQAVAAIGYRASPYDASRVDDLHRTERKRALMRLAIAGLGMMQVMMYTVPVWLAGEDMTFDVEQLMRWAGLILTLPVLVYSAAPIFTSAWRDARARRIGMDVPVALGIAAAFLASAWATIRSTGDVYFDSVTMFVFLLLAARFLESQVRARAALATDELARLIPATASWLPQWPRQQPVRTVPVAKLRPGDVVLVRPGEHVPGDGHIIDGAGEIDEAMLTGESRPVVRGIGSALTGGAINLVSPLVVRIDRVGEQTALAGIVRLLDRAAAEKPPLAALADRVAGQFVVGLLAIAAATALWWSLHDPARALWVTVAVLVITCPCALSLATPAALAAAASRLARHGVLPTRGHAIETLARATHFVFDKTGTLTTGQLRVTSFMPVEDMQASGLLARVTALESRSEHPLGNALAAFAARDAQLAESRATLQVDGLRHVPGGGVEGRVDGVLYRLGTAAFVTAPFVAVTGTAAGTVAGTAADGTAADGTAVDGTAADGTAVDGTAVDGAGTVVTATDAAATDATVASAGDALLDGAMRRGETLVLLGDESGVLARFTLSDQLRPGARELIAGLRATGGKIMLLSGDHPATVEAIALAVGIPIGVATARGGMSPEHKLSFVRDLQAGGAVVAMFGDGVNDAPVLAQAQVSIAPGSGTQVAQAAADMIWLAPGESADMGNLLEAIRTVRHAMRVIRQNLAWASAYNLVAVPLAVAGLVTPWIAALGMSLSSLLVVGNSMRLLGVRRARGRAETIGAARPAAAPPA